MRCFALIQLDAEAEGLLAARTRIGEEPTWVHRCQLEHGHGGDHRCVDASTECLLEWDDLVTAPRVVGHQSGREDVSRADRRPLVDLETSPPSRGVSRVVNGAEHPAGPPSVAVVPNRVEVQALDAIANALERMCDVFTALIEDLDGLARVGHRRAGSMDHDPGGRTR